MNTMTLEMPLLNFGLLSIERCVPVFEYTEEDYKADVDTVRRLMAQKTELK